VRVEAVLLTILVFAGVNVAWLLLFEEAPSDRAPSTRTPQHSRQRCRITAAEVRAT
jgi:hypothetical protein